MAISLLIAGDVVPNGRTIALFKNRESNILFGEIKNITSATDYNIVNLECPVIAGSPYPIKKHGPALYSSPEVVDVLKDIGFNVLTLANNHIYDQGDQGVNTTIEYCKSNDIRFVGAGSSQSEARKMLFLNKGSETVAIINACEHEFSIAQKDHGGANPMDLIQMSEDIAEAKSKADKIILILHGGVEHYPYPTPRMKKWYRHFIDIGADAILNHHQHCMCGYEIYKGKLIAYGLGNFNFQSFRHQDQLTPWNYGYAVRLQVEKDISFEFVPYIQNGLEAGIHISKQDQFLQQMDILNIPIGDDYILNQRFETFVLSREFDTKLQLLPSFFQIKGIRGAIRKGLLGSIFNQKDGYRLLNKIQCESHHDTLIKLFETLTK